MKIFFYILGILAILYGIAIYYENEREKSFLKNDLELAGEKLVHQVNQLETEENAIRTAQKENLMIINAVAGPIQNDIRRRGDDVRGAIKLRQ